MVKRMYSDDTTLNGSKSKHQNKIMKKEDNLKKCLFSNKQPEQNKSEKVCHSNESENMIEPTDNENLQDAYMVENEYKKEITNHIEQLVDSDLVSANNLTKKERDNLQIMKVPDAKNCKFTWTNKNMRVEIKQVCSGLFLTRFDNDDGDFDDVIHGPGESSLETEIQDVCVTFKEDGDEMETITSTSTGEEKCCLVHTANVENVHQNCDGSCSKWIIKSSIDVNNQSLKTAQMNCSKHNCIVELNETECVEQKLKLEPVEKKEIQSLGTGNVNKELCSYDGKREFTHLNEKESLNSDKTISDLKIPQISQHFLKEENFKEPEKSFDPPDKMDVLKCVESKSTTEGPELNGQNYSFEKETEQKVEEKIVSFLKESSNSATPIDELDWLAVASIIDLNCGPTQAINLFKNKLKKNFEDLKKLAIAQENIAESTEDLLEKKDHLLLQIKKQVLSLRLLKSTANYQPANVQCASMNEDDKYGNYEVINKYMEDTNQTESGSLSKSVNVETHSSLSVNTENCNLLQNPSSSPHLKNNSVISKALYNSDTSNRFGNYLMFLASNASRVSDYSSYQKKFQLPRKVAENFQDVGMSVNLAQNSRLNGTFVYQPSSMLPVHEEHHQTLAQDAMQLVQPSKRFDYQPFSHVPIQQQHHQTLAQDAMQLVHPSKRFDYQPSSHVPIQQQQQQMVISDNTQQQLGFRKASYGQLLQQDKTSREQLQQSDHTATSVRVVSKNPRSQQATIGIPSSVYNSFLNSVNTCKANIGQEQTASATNRLLLNQPAHCSSWPVLQTLDRTFHQRTGNSSKNSASPGSEHTFVSSRTSTESELRNGHLNNGFNVLLMSPIHYNLNERIEETQQNIPLSPLTYVPQLQRTTVHQSHPYSLPQDFSKTGDRVNIPGRYSWSNDLVNQQVRTTGSSITHQPWNDLSHFKTFERVPDENTQTSTNIRPNPEINRGSQTVSVKCNLCEKAAKFKCIGCYSALYCGQSCAYIHWIIRHSSECRLMNGINRI
ncbi:uncharacterized protein LOC143253760 [Tachypleus tridentatus]|uniref:uncharacterized protein LOC143253760 n=1 Tax=Tachypleus tridentatus TaxID=6853 RepID=UPI003FD3979A